MIIKLDIKRVPFVMEAVELSGLLYNAKIKHAPGFVVLGGTIDRVDRKGDEVRIIDDKPGRINLILKTSHLCFCAMKRIERRPFKHWCMRCSIKTIVRYRQPMLKLFRVTIRN